MTEVEKMNKIILYINCIERSQKKLLNIISALDSIMKNIVELKKIIGPIKDNIIVHINESQNFNCFKIVYKNNSYPNMIFFGLPKKAIDELGKKDELKEDPITILEFIYRETRSEYNSLGNRYNKRSETGFSLSKLPKHNHF